jgi:hypothetical protein
MKKIASYKESKQCVLRDWVVTDSQHFNAVNGVGFQK